MTQQNDVVNNVEQQNEEVKEKRKRRTKAEMAAARNEVQKPSETKTDSMTFSKWKTYWSFKFENFFGQLLNTKMSFKKSTKKHIRVPDELLELIQEDIDEINKHFKKVYYSNNQKKSTGILSSENELYCVALMDFFNIEQKDGKFVRRTGKVSTYISNNKKDIQSVLDRNQKLEQQKKNERVQKYREKEKKEKENMKKQIEELQAQIWKLQGGDIDENEVEQKED
jgi:hypothetical protein